GLVETLFLFRERRGHHDRDDGIEVARAAAGARQPLAREPEPLPVLRPGRHLERHPALERRQLDRRAERRLPGRERKLDVEVAPARPEQRVRREADVEVEIAVRPSAEAGAALPGEAQPLAVGRAARNAHADALLAQLQPALGAAEGPAAHGGAAARLEAARAANAERLEEVGEIDVVERRAAGRPARAEALAEGAEPVLRGTEVLAGAEAAEIVVGGALLLVAQRLVGLGDLLETLLRVRLLGDVRVVLAGEAAVGLLDLVLGGAALDAEDLVVVLVLHFRWLTTVTSLPSRPASTKPRRRASSSISWLASRMCP